MKGVDYKRLTGFMNASYIVVKAHDNFVWKIEKKSREFNFVALHHFMIICYIIWFHVHCLGKAHFIQSITYRSMLECYE